ncbi:helix-turn-helix domain-containing protein [Candidatus Micrarchaeota archaeon]|jgi:DNA-directed RNA polymerase specialized sigma24 family protein|nr:helix-turn-helix domain-containing protein [Candidatus Micrarchaeota archaeon]
MSPELKELVLRAQQGDKAAMEEILTRFLPVVKKYTRYMGYEQDDATQDLREVLIKIIKNYPLSKD